MFGVEGSAMNPHIFSGFDSQVLTSFAEGEPAGKLQGQQMGFRDALLLGFRC